MAGDGCNCSCELATSIVNDMGFPTDALQSCNRFVYQCRLGSYIAVRFGAAVRRGDGLGTRELTCSTALYRPRDTGMLNLEERTHVV